MNASKLNLEDSINRVTLNIQRTRTLKGNRNRLIRLQGTLLIKYYYFSPRYYHISYIALLYKR